MVRSQFVCDLLPKADNFAIVRIKKNYLTADMSGKLLNVHFGVGFGLVKTMHGLTIIKM